MLRRLVNDWNEGLEGVNKPKATYTHTHTETDPAAGLLPNSDGARGSSLSLSLYPPLPPLSPLFPISHGADLSNAGSQSGFGHQV